MKGGESYSKSEEKTLYNKEETGYEADKHVKCISDQMKQGGASVKIAKAGGATLLDHSLGVHIRASLLTYRKKIQQIYELNKTFPYAMVPSTLSTSRLILLLFLTQTATHQTNHLPPP